MNITLDYAYNPAQRQWGETKAIKLINAKLSSKDNDYTTLLQSFKKFNNDFKKIALRSPSDSLEPAWINGWLPALDSAAIYSFLALNNPSLYLEIGSGNSTKFARKAIKDHSLKTKIISIDPKPRANIDKLCDEVHRIPCEQMEHGFFTKMPCDTVLFVDNSHRSFQNSDVTVFFLEILSVLPKGVIWGIHDIFLPEDYPAEWLERYYNEQYLLGAYLLGGGGLDKVLLPSYYIYKNEPLNREGAAIFEDVYFKDIEKYGVGFWMSRN